MDQAENSIFKYITVTICPNWQNEDVKIGDVGYVEYDFVEAGENYFERDSKEVKQYNYSTNYFINFITKREDINKDYKF